MKTYHINTALPEGCLSRVIRYDNKSQNLSIIIATDEAFFEKPPEIFVKSPEQSLGLKLIGRAPFYFKQISKNKGFENIQVKNCLRYRGKIDFEAIGFDNLTIEFKGQSNCSSAALTMREFEAEISEIQEQLNQLGANKLTAQEKNLARQSFLKLKSMPKDWRQQISHTELVASSLGAMNARASYTWRLLNKIRDHHQASGNPQKYEEFEARFNELVAPNILLPHGFAKSNPLHESDPIHVVHLVKDTFKFIENIGYESFINSGSLLGLVRDGAFIPHDDDIDVGVIMHSQSEEDVAREWINFRDRLLAQDLIDLNKQKKSSQVLKFKNDLNIGFDLFAAWFDKQGRFSVYPHSHKNLLREDIYPFQYDKTYGIQMPANAEKMLTSNYGENWKSPDPMFRFNWGEAGKTFAAFTKPLASQLETVVVTYGTFDLFHIGHVRLLQRAASMGTRLIVGCSTDEFNAIKGKACTWPYEQRVEVLRSCRFVDDVFPEENWEQKSRDIQTFGIKKFVMGGDWAGKFNDLKPLCEVIYLPRTQGISTTEIKAQVRSAL